MEEPNAFNKIVFLLDQNIRLVQVGVYTVAFTGFAIALRSVRPFSRFKHASEIPNHFVERRTVLKGTVERIEPNGALLMVQHKPLIQLLRSKNECLPVKIAGVNISGHGISWLQSVVAGNKITFIPVHKRKDCVQCEVTVPLATTDKKKFKNLNIGPELVAIGFATIAPIEKSLLASPQHLKYYSMLTAAEQTALRKKMGVWYYVQPTKEISMKFFTRLRSFLRLNSNSKTVRVSTT